MMKTALKIALAPVMLAIRLMLGLVAEPSGSSHWFLRGPGLLKITCLQRFVCITDRRFSYLWRYVWQQPGSSRCTSIRGKP